MRLERDELLIWLPASARLIGEPTAARLRQQATALTPGSMDYLAALAALFQPEPAAELAAGALIRDYVRRDAGKADWLAADPAWIQPDLNGARLMAVSHLQLDQTEAEALVAALQPVFSDERLALYPTTPGHWQVKLATGMAVPHLVPPARVLGDDVLAHLPAGETGRRWRRLGNDCQTILHQHPLNTRRRQQGLPPVNSLWFWGGGRLPQGLATPLQGVLSEDLLLRALAARAGIVAAKPALDALQQLPGRWLLDLEALDAAALAPWWPALRRLAGQRRLRLHTADGQHYQHAPWHRLRFWRREARA